jgi:4-hydroxy-tetrahydrodipicolinate synthase
MGAMPGETLRGVYPILAMPFDTGGRIDADVLRREVDYLVAAGVDGVGIALASEVPMLSEAERDLALQVVVAQVRGRVKVVMNTSAVGTDLAVSYSRRAEELGADALMVLPPPPAPGAETIDYYARIADATTLPVFIQDVPTAPVPPGLAVQIATRAPHAWYLKAETPPTPPRVTEVLALAGDHVTVFGGAGGAFLIEELRRGSVGTMPGSTIPEVFVQVWKLAEAGRLDEAEAIFAPYAGLLRLLAQGTGIGFYLTKEVLRLRGVFSRTTVRRPAVEPDPLAYQEIRRQVEALGLDRTPHAALSS